jgi:Zn finger protein HypA/HybF involved in hydrogenase expression
MKNTAGLVKLNRNEAAQLNRGIEENSKPNFVSKANFKFAKKFGTTKCLWCKALFIKHRAAHNFCCQKCGTYQRRKYVSIREAPQE